MHGRSRKLALAEASTRDEITDAFPSDDAVVIEIASFVEETRANERICLECGGDGSRHEGCSHGEVARLHEPSRAASEMVARLRRAAAEHRAASRALRALVTSELGRGRAELETTTAAAIPLSDEDEDEAAVAAIEAAVVPCPRCAEREVEGASVVVNPPRPARKRGRAGIDQQTFPFLKEAVAESEGEKGEVASLPTPDLATSAHATTPEPWTPHEPPTSAAEEPPPAGAKAAPRRPRSLRA